MKLFWKIYISTLLFSLVMAGAGSYLIARRIAQDAETRMLDEMESKADFMVLNLEKSFLESRLPVETLRTLNSGESIVFWWVVREDGTIYLADESDFMRTDAYSYFPDLNLHESAAAIVFDQSKRLGIVRKSFEPGTEKWSYWVGFSLNSIYSMQRYVYSIVFVSVLALVVIYGAVLYFIIGRTLSPIDVLMSGIREVGTGDLDFTIDVSSNDELGDLARSFNAMTGDLQKTTTSITDLNKEIKERKRVEQDLRTREQEFRLIFEHARDAIFWADPETGSIVNCNRAAEDLLEKEKEDIIGMHQTELHPPEEAEHYSEDFRKDVSIKSTEHESLVLTSSGKKIPVIVSTSLTDIDGKRIIQGIFHNITNRKKDEESLKRAYEELKETQSQLIHSEKMAGIGQLAAGIAHEINNPTGFVIGNLQVLDQYMKSVFNRVDRLEAELKNTLENGADMMFIREDTPKLIKDTLEGAERIKRIVADLKDFTHPAKSIVKQSDINREIEKALSIVANELKHDCTVVKKFEPLPPVFCNPQEIQQVFINILMNAGQAMDTFGKIEIRTRRGDDAVAVEIEDNGKGINEKHLENIFDPFFTTKDVGQGTGLGLSVSYGIIQKHNGEIKVKSEPGKGSTFTIILPLKGDNNE